MLTKTKELQGLYKEWLFLNPGKDLDSRAVSDWLIATGKWQPQVFDPAKALAKEISRAAREETMIDPQGREVRKRHSYTYIDETGQYRWLFADIVTAEPEKMALSLQHRRRAALGDIVQLNTDRESYNDNNPFGAKIQMSFNFEEDLEELQHPGEYPDSPTEL